MAGRDRGGWRQLTALAMSSESLARSRKKTSVSVSAITFVNVARRCMAASELALSAHENSPPMRLALSMLLL